MIATPFLSKILRNNFRGWIDILWRVILNVMFTQQRNVSYSQTYFHILREFETVRRINQHDPFEKSTLYY